MGIKKQQIIDYYNDCEIDYKLVWKLSKSMAMHFGYWDNSIKHLVEALNKENEVLAQKARIKQSDYILDAGCGVGGSSIFLAKNFGCKVLGITITRGQVKKATKNAKKHQVDTLATFAEMDFNRTSFKNKTFDVIWAIESICHSPDKNKFIKEAYRILKPKGRLIVADGFASKNNYIKSESDWMQKWLQGWAVEFLETEENFKNYLKEAGFKNISYSNITKNVMPTSRRMYLLSYPAIIFAKLGELLGVRNKIQTQNVIAARYQYKALKSELWKYGIFYAEKV